MSVVCLLVPVKEAQLTAFKEAQIFELSGTQSISRILSFAREEYPNARILRRHGNYYPCSPFSQGLGIKLLAGFWRNHMRMRMHVVLHSN